MAPAFAGAFFFARSQWSEEGVLILQEKILFLPINKENLLEQMTVFEKEFSKMKEYIKNDESEKLRQMMRLSTSRRSLFDKKK